MKIGIRWQIWNMKQANSFLETYSKCLDDKKINRTQQANIVLEERRRKYILINKSSLFITKIIVEGCVTAGHGEKGCEAILYVEEKNSEDYSGVKAFFIELKGCSVGDALKQIDNSFETTKSYLKNIISFGRIVPSEYKRTKFLMTFEQRLFLKFKATGGDLIIREKLTDTI
jgi:hypothetical protein